MRMYVCKIIMELLTSGKLSGSIELGKVLPIDG